MRKEITLEEAKQVMPDYPNEDDYVQAHYQQFLINGEHSDNTMDSSIYWTRCNKIAFSLTSTNDL